MRDGIRNGRSSVRLRGLVALTGPFHQGRGLPSETPKQETGTRGTSVMIITRRDLLSSYIKIIGVLTVIFGLAKRYGRYM